MKCLLARLLCLLMAGAFPLLPGAGDYLVVFKQGAAVSHDLVVFEPSTPEPSSCLARLLCRRLAGAASTTPEPSSCLARRRLAGAACRRSAFPTPIGRTNF